VEEAAAAGAPARPDAARILTWALAAVTLALCVVPFVLVLAISFGRKIEGAAWVWDLTLRTTSGSSSARCGRTR
jgi:putative spermidine/putrescine transport system permease protein